jgi:hypothetical protein
MITTDEENFLVYWEENRSKKKSLFKQLSLGISLGLFIGVAILLNFISGWYTRATMVANSRSTPIVLILAFLIIALFFGVFYTRHKWEMNEQHFLELKMKKEKEESLNNMQQNEQNSSQLA